MSRFQRIWITGGSTGIGRATALAYLAAGCTVAVSARPSANLLSLASAAVDLPGQLAVFPLDVTEAEACAAAVTEIEAQIGPLDLAIFNAGVSFPTDDPLDPAIHARTFAVNYVGQLNPLVALVPVMRTRGRGEIALVASVAGYRGLPGGSAAYCASKAALRALAESLHVDLGRAGIAVRLISPGFVRTPMTDKNRFPMPCLMEPEAAASALLAGLEGRRFEITFPKRFTWLVKAASRLPYALFFPLIRRLTKL